MLRDKPMVTLIFAIVTIFVAKQVFADLSDAHWHVDARDRDIVKIVNGNKASFRSYGFNRNTGSLKWIKFNTSRPDDERIYINGESSYALFLGGVEQKAEFVSFDAQEMGLSCDTKGKRGNDVLAIATSRYKLPEADVEISIEYRFRRDNEVEVDCAATTKKPLPDDAIFSISYPIRDGYELDDQRRDVYNIELFKAWDSGRLSLYFRSRASIGEKTATKMSVVVSEKDNVSSPYHNRVITLSSSLKDPIKAKGYLKTTDDQWLYSFCFSIPLHSSLFDKIRSIW